MTNTALWESVQKTDPKFTKQFSRGGGFKGTATNATYLARRATETFGPCGIGWGITVLHEEIIDGAPLLIDGVTVANEKIHKVHARLWYVLNDHRGEVEQFGQTQIVGKNKNGFFTDEEAPKKSLTDAMSKCLSLLGFSADIHLGLYDDNKYVAEMREEFAPKEGPSAEELREIRCAELVEQYAESVEAIRSGIDSGDLYTAAEAWYELPQDVMRGLWVAPTKVKSAPFTTKQRETMKSNEFTKYRPTQEQAA